MRTHRVLAGVVVVALSVSVLMADEMSDLRNRFESRDGRVQQLKVAGTIGETSAGLLEAVKSASGEDRRVMEEENGDRKRLYALLAQRDGVTAEVVADRAARRNFGRARAGEYLKYPDGVWRQK